MSLDYEIKRCEDLAEEIRNTLDAIGPTHALYRDLNDELIKLTEMVAELKKEAKNIQL